MLLPDRFVNWIAIALCASVAGHLVGALAPPLTQLGGLMLAICAGLIGFALARAERIRKGIVRELEARPGAAPTNGQAM